MDWIIAAIGAAFRAIAIILWVPCRVTGRLIMKVVRSGNGPSVPRAEISQRSAQRPGNDTRQARESTGAALAVEQLAQKMAAGTVTMQDMHDVDADVVKWLSGLDHQQLCRLICVDRLGDYMSGRLEVRGLPRYLEMPPRPAERRTRDPEPGYAPIAVPAI